MKNSVPKKNVIDGDTQELITEHGIKNYVDTTNSGGGGVTDHGALTGLEDDDHTQYLKADASRAITANWDVDGNQTLYIDTVNNKIGIGTNSPYKGLHIESTDFHKAGIQLVRNTVGAGCSTIGFFHHRNSATVANGDYTGAFQFFGYDGASNIISAQIGAIIDGTPGTSDMPGKLVFFTTSDGGSSVTERMVIKSDGKVGIGETTPAAVLDVNGDLILQNGTSVSEFSTDGTLAGDSDDAVPTEKAVKTYVDGEVVTDHGALSGLSDDDHTQYIKADGTRAFTGVVTGVTPTADSHLATKLYVDNNSGGISDTDSVQWKKQQYFDANTLTASGTTVAWSLETHQFTALTLAGNYTLSNPTDVPASGIGTYVLIVKQDATGGRTLSFSSKYKFSDGNAPTLSSAANAVDVLTFVYESSSGNMYGSAKLNLQ